jgi:hypothetical protein
LCEKKVCETKKLYVFGFFLQMSKRQKIGPSDQSEAKGPSESQERCVGRIIYSFTSELADRARLCCVAKGWSSFANETYAPQVVVRWQDLFLFNITRVTQVHEVMIETRFFMDSTIMPKTGVFKALGHGFGLAMDSWARNLPTIIQAKLFQIAGQLDTLWISARSLNIPFNFFTRLVFLELKDWDSRSAERALTTPMFPLESLANAVQLRSIKIEACHTNVISEDGLEAWSGLRHLQSLAFVNIQCMNALASPLVTLSHMTGFSLVVTGKQHEKLKRSERLKWFRLWKFTRKFPTCAKIELSPRLVSSGDVAELTNDDDYKASLVEDVDEDELDHSLLLLNKNVK